MLAVAPSLRSTVPAGRPLVKVCGIMRPDDAVVAAEAGADMLGFVFAPSRRQLSLEVASMITNRIANRIASESRPLMVGVFVNEATDVILQTAARVGLDIIQMSGDENPEQVHEVALRCRVLKALRFPPGTTAASALAACSRYAPPGTGGRIQLLVDTHHEDVYGGSGKTS
ncbi:MAG TPA: phosphoribosylanthranilate isomerase, partial [Chloroflexia bacterium]|nr:phosphoribosylanthranilate isomerase [Chloroflexia bacterium]